MTSAEGDDEMPQLSAGALDALKEFYSEKDSRQKQFEDLRSQAEDSFEQQKLSMDAFTEDWNVSQFWYNDETATLLAKQLLDGTTNDTAVAIVSAPSVFIQLKNLMSSLEAQVRPEVVLLEYDERFSVFKEFVFYDFANPTRLPEQLKGHFDRIICDPPFLSEDSALTVRWLSKSWNAPGTSSGVPSTADNSPALIVCTGERMEPLIHKLYGKAGIRTTTFEPQHSKGLSNEFRCYANFPCKDWKFR
ncbi:hypothetical protein NA57DRAFT_42016 [Rhizodiscina lignyota]|uniref:Protein-lysine N-methyltransferase EFM5 n=1 Tax=Rhizodiscina lignyota TaxID=1504668 RepID=A0A9P4M863_9PEZI|nr:hypothetical protein NA57DRAFT_42016 [Rhizodiscina lignyota]